MAEPSDLTEDLERAIEESGFDLTKRSGPVDLDQRRKSKDATRRTEALALRMAGLSFEAIGERLGIGMSGARDLVNRTLERAENRLVEQERDLENQRLDRAQAAIWSKVLDGDLKAVDSFLKLSARRAKMNGLDAPIKVDLSVSVRQEMEAALSQLERVVLGQVIPGQLVAEGDDDSDR